MSKSDTFDYTSEGTFKRKLPKLYKLVIAEGLKHKVDWTKMRLEYCEGIGDLVDVSYIGRNMGFSAQFKGGERLGYRVIVTDCFEITDDDEETD